MKKQIAIITSGFLPVPATKGGAVENLIVNLLNENEKEKEYNFTIYSINDEKAREESKKYNESTFEFYSPNFVVKVLDYIIFWVAKKILRKKNSQSYRYIVQRLSYFNFASKKLKKNSFDNVLLENHPTQYYSLKWRKNYIKYAGKVIYHCHNEFPGTFGCKKIIDTTSQFICVSEYIKNRLSSYLELDSNKFKVLRNCVNEELFNSNIDNEKKKTIREKYGFKSSDFVMIFTGRIVPEKGVLELVKALKQADNKNIKLLIVGSALNALSSKTEYQNQIEKEIDKIGDNIKFTGFVEYKKIFELYNAADIAVMPSVWNDPAPLSVIESIMCGLPIITTNSGGIPEYVNLKNAIVLDRENNLVDNLAENILKVYKDKELQKSMSKESIKLSKEMNVKTYYQNFKNLVK